MVYTNQQMLRRELHKQLIDIDGRHCIICNDSDRREIHRIIPGYMDGEYTRDNVEVRCFICHRLVHPMSKFRIGDRVVLNGRTPQFIDLARHRPRRIIAVKYDPAKQCNFYLVGSNARGPNSGNGNPLEGFSDYWFRSYHLHKPRRYHFKRKYIRRNQIGSACDQN